MGDDRRLMEVARRQLELVTVAQCERAGVSQPIAGRRVRQGLWQRVHRGVYKCGPSPLTLAEREVAALLVAGRGGVLSHFSAAGRWHMPVDLPSRVHLSLPRDRKLKPLHGVVMHRPEYMPLDHTVRLGRIPVTSVERTIVDLASALSELDLRKVIDSRLRVPTCPPYLLDELLRISEGLRGAPRLRAVVKACEEANGPGETVLESIAADLFQVVKVKPERNYLLKKDGKVLCNVEFAWPPERLAVETDGYAYHSQRRSFERDREKTNLLQDNGWQVYRFTNSQLTHQKDLCLRQVQEAHARRHAELQRP